MATKRKPSSTATGNQVILGDSCSFNDVLKILSPRWKSDELLKIVPLLCRWNDKWTGTNTSCT